MTTAVAPRAWEPHAYQVEAMSWLVSRGGAGLFLDPGLGKTSIVLGAVSTLKRTGRVTRGVLVVAPLRPLYNVWDAANPDSEPRKWSNFAGLRTAMLHGPQKLEALRSKADLYLINPEGLGWLLSQLRATSTWPFEVLVVDESTAFKNSRSLRFRLLREVLTRFRYRWILTGTPAPNGLLDLFAQLYLVDGGAALGRFITHYRRTYFAPTGYGGYTWVPQPGAEEKIYARVAPLVLRMSEADYLKLPALIPTTVSVTLPSKARKLYDQLEKIFFAELRSGSVTAANAGVAAMKCRQVANGGIYLDKGDETADSIRVRGAIRRWELAHEEKSAAVVEILDELSGKPALISYDFQHDLERLRQHPALRDIPFLGASNTPAEDRAFVAAWNRGELRGLFVNPQSIAHGFNLQGGGRAVIFHSLTWNYEHYEQLIRRVRRQGQRFKVFVYHVVARGTVDEALMLGLGRKASTQRSFLDALRAYALRRAA